jgi:hypothetical protein
VVVVDVGDCSCQHQFDATLPGRRIGKVPIFIDRACSDVVGGQITKREATPYEALRSLHADLI